LKCNRCAVALSPTTLYCAACDLQHAEKKPAGPAADPASGYTKTRNIARGYLDIRDYDNAKELYRFLCMQEPEAPSHWQGLILCHTHRFTRYNLTSDEIAYLERCAEKAYGDSTAPKEAWDNYRKEYDAQHQASSGTSSPASKGQLITWIINLVLTGLVIWWLQSLDYHHRIHTVTGFLSVHGILVGLSVIASLIAIIGSARYASVPACLCVLFHAAQCFLELIPDDAGWFLKFLFILFFGIIELAVVFFSWVCVMVESADTPNPKSEKEGES